MTRCKERDGAASLFDAGAQVVFTGADTPAVADVAAEKGKWGVTYDHPGSCKVDACLTAPYWIWGPEYTRIAEAGEGRDLQGRLRVLRRRLEGHGPLRLHGRREARSRASPSLPAADVQLVKDTLAKMLAGEFGRFDVFAGPIADNTGKELARRPARSSSSPTSTSSRPAPPGRECKTCMYWWNEGITVPLPDLSS